MINEEDYKRLVTAILEGIMEKLDKRQMWQVEKGLTALMRLAEMKRDGLVLVKTKVGEWVGGSKK